ncbi:MAG: hypothetical protein ACYCYP_09390 [Leptospirales bacterium]
MDKQQEAIDIHLSLKEPNEVNGTSYFSCLGHALKEARSVTGRNVESGELEDKNGSHKWLGAIAYLLIVDQIGECYKTSEGIPKVESPFRKALHYFSDLSKMDSKILYGLRCSLVHNYSLVSRYQKDERSNFDYCYVYELEANTGSKLIRSATEEWDGSICKIDRTKHSTGIILKKIGDLVEGIYKKIFDLHKNGQLEINMAPEDLIKRFTFTVYE